MPDPGPDPGSRPRPLPCNGKPGYHLPAMQTSITLSLNGENKTYPAPLSVAELLGLLELDTRKVAVERNEEIVPRSVYQQTWLQGGDQLEIVHFIGGG